MIWTMGEIIVEIMRNKENLSLDSPGVFLGPYPSGAPAIFIDTAARLGQKTGIIGAVGNDDFGKCVINRLENDGVDCSNVVIDGHVSTGCAFVTYFDDGSRKFIFHIGNSAAGRAVCPKDEKIPKSDYFHIMGCSLMADEKFGKEIIKAMKMFRAKGARISFDPNVRPELLGNAELINEVMSVTNVLLPGISELLTISQKETIDEAVTACFENENLEIIALKNGSNGCRVFTRNSNFNMGVYEIIPADATGAGDCFDGAFLSGLCEGKSIEECAMTASAAAALNTASFGPMEGNISRKTVAELINKGIGGCK